MHYYKFNIGDWHLATSHLSLEEEAIYFKLINYYYDSEQPIPVETQTVIRRLRLGSYSDTVSLILSEFFELSTDGWHHKRCDDELQKYHQKAEKNKTVGKLGGRPRKNNDLDNNPKITQTVSENNPNVTLTTNHKPITNNHNKDKAPKVACPSDVNEEVWNDWLQLRKTKKASVTQTVLNGAIKEAEKAQLSLEDFLKIWCLRGSQGLEASWIKPEEKIGKKYATPDKMKNMWAEIDAYNSPLLGDK